MKTYDQMIQYVVDECTVGQMNLRHTKWPAYLLLAHAYDKTIDQVSTDISFGIDHYVELEKIRAKQRARVTNVERRQANLAKA
jgi:hypothetical protein